MPHILGPLTTREAAAGASAYGNERVADRIELICLRELRVAHRLRLQYCLVDRRECASAAKADTGILEIRRVCSILYETRGRCAVHDGREPPGDRA